MRELFFIGLGFVLFLNFLAIRKVGRSELHTDAQKLLQTLLVVFVPVIGAWLVLGLLNPKPDRTRGDFPPAPGPNRDAISGAISSNSRLP